MIKLSVIIATYNRAHYLIQTLDSLVDQTLDKKLWEVVVVNNNSNDNTDELFDKFAAKHPQLNLRRVTQTKQGLSHARNCGIENTKGQYIVIIDDDEQANEAFLEVYYRAFEENPDVAVFGGVMKAKYEIEKPRWMSFITERFIGSTIYMGPKQRQFPNNKYPIGGNFGFRRNGLEKYGIFDPELGRKGNSLMAGEEKDLIDRFRNGGEKVYYLPDAIILHSIPATRLNDDYFTKVTRMIGVSERIRTKNISSKAYLMRLVSECVKWGAATVLAIGYTLSFQPAKGFYLLKMRWNVTGGLLAIFK